jgi:histone H1/5
MSAAQVMSSATKKVAGTGKKSGAKKPHAVLDHPKYSEMVKQALMALKERGGSSRQAVLKYIMANFNVGKDEAIVNSHLKMALRAGVKNSTLKQSKGTGATGSFRLGAEASKKKTAKKAKTSAAGSKKSTEKKAPKKAKKSGKKSGPKSPKKVVKKASTPSIKKQAPAAKPKPAAAAPAVKAPKKKASAKKVSASKQKKN